jgi:predicted ATP-dependent serine protease
VDTATAVVGRAAELAQLDAALNSVAAGHGRTVVVGGELGIGKTCLLTELAARGATSRLPRASTRTLSRGRRTARWDRTGRSGSGGTS